MTGKTWLSDLAKGLTDGMVPKLTRLATMLDDVVLMDGQADAIVWRFTRPASTLLAPPTCCSSRERCLWRDTT